MKRVARYVLSRIDLMILVGSLVATLFFWVQAEKTGQNNRSKSQEEVSKSASVAITNILQQYTTVAYHIEALFQSSVDVERGEFSSFVKAVSRNNNYPAVERYGFVTTTVNGAYIKGASNYLVDAEGNDLEPDLANLNVTTNADKTSIQTDKITGQKILIHPIYKDEKMLGYAVVYLSSEKLYSEIKKILRDVQYLNIIDSDGEFFKIIDSQNLQLVNTGSFDIFDREFVIQLENLPVDHQQPNEVILVGTVASFVLYVLTYILSTFGVKAENLAKNRTGELAKFKLAADSASDHIIITDVDGKVLYANKMVEKLTGYSMNEIIGSTPRLWGGLMGLEFYKNFWKVIKFDKKPFIGEVRNLRKGGIEYFAFATVSPILDSEGTLLGFVGVERDITEVKKYQIELEDRVKKSTLELQASIEALGGGYLMIDTEGKVILTNHYIDKLLEKPRGTWGFSDLCDMVSPGFDLNAAWHKVSNYQHDIPPTDVLWRGRILEIRLSPVFSEEPERRQLGTLIIMTDVTSERQLTRSRDEFFSIASHELRTPLTAIRGNTALIQQMYLDKIKDPDFVGMVADIHDSSIRLIGIVNSFLNMSRLEMGKLKFKKDKINIEELVEKTIEELKHEAEVKGINLNMVQSGTHVPEVVGEADRIKEVLINLVGNAIKFTEKGGVTLSFRVNPGNVTILVSDTGKGISEANQTLLFHKFQQASNSLLTRDTSKGTGLGLYISKLMAEGMGGSVTLVNSQEGKGSTFAFSLLV